MPEERIPSSKPRAHRRPVPAPATATSLGIAAVPHSPGRRPECDPIAYGGYWIVPMREALAERGPKGQDHGVRYDVLEQVGEPPVLNRRKTCASLVTAKGWIDTYGETA